MSGVNVVSAPSISNTQECILANSASLDPNDLVTIDSNGFLARVATDERVAGYYVEARKTVTSDNQTVALVKGRYEVNIFDAVLEMTADQACVQTDLGAYANVVLATDEQKVNLSAGSAGLLEIIDFDPARDGSTTIVRVKIAEPQTLAFAAA